MIFLPLYQDEEQKVMKLLKLQKKIEADIYIPASIFIEAFQIINKVYIYSLQ